MTPPVTPAAWAGNAGPTDAPSSYMVWAGKVDASISKISVSVINNAITAHGASRHLYYLQMALQVNGSWDGTVDGRWSQAFIDQMTAARSSQWGDTKFGPFNVPTVSKAFVADVIASQLDGCNKLPVID